MRIHGQRLQGLFGEKKSLDFIEIDEDHLSKNLSKMNVNIDSLRGFFMLGGVKEGTQTLISDIHGLDDKPNRELVLSFQQLQSYWKVPTYYMGPKEHFVIAINLYFHFKDIVSYYDRHPSVSCEKRKVETIERYLAKSKSMLHEDPELENTLILYKGIKHYDEARECRSYDPKKSKKLLKTAKVQFIELLKKKVETPTVVTFLGIIEALLGRVESALQFLIHAADLVFNPQKIYGLMSKLFNVIRMKKASLFYRRRARTGSIRFSHRPQEELTNVITLRAA